MKILFILLLFSVPTLATTPLPPRQAEIDVQYLLDKLLRGDPIPESLSHLRHIDTPLAKLLVGLVPEFEYKEAEKRYGYTLKIVEGDYLKLQPNVTHSAVITTDKHVLCLRLRWETTGQFFIIGYAVELNPGVTVIDPWPTKLQDFPLKSDTLSIPGFKIDMRESQNQDSAGTAGTLHDFTIRNTRTGVKRTFTDQSVRVAILQPYRGWPQLEIWTRADGGSWCRSLHRFTGRDYEHVRTDEFSEYELSATDKTQTATMPQREGILYYVETRVPGKQSVR